MKLKDLLVVMNDQEKSILIVSNYEMEYKF